MSTALSAVVVAVVPAVTLNQVDEAVDEPAPSVVVSLNVALDEGAAEASLLTANADDARAALLLMPASVDEVVTTASSDEAVATASVSVDVGGDGSKEAVEV